MVRVIVNGKFEIVSLKIEKDVVNPEDIEMLQDLITAAVNEGIRKAQEMASSEMAKITGGLEFPAWACKIVHESIRTTNQTLDF